MGKVILTVDAQHRFMHPNGEDSVDGCGDASQKINEVLINALRNETVITSTGYGPKNGGGLKNIDEIILVDDEFYYNVSDENYGIDMNIAGTCWHINFERGNTPDVWDNTFGQPDNLETFLRTEGINEITVVGCNYRGSVEYTIQGLLDSLYNVRVIKDAVVGLTDDILDDMIDDGVSVITTEEFVAGYEGNKDA